VVGYGVSRRVPGTPVAGEHVVSQVLRRPVAAGAVVQQPAPRVGDQAAPRTALISGDAPGQMGGDRPVPGQVAGLVVETQQGRERDSDLDRGAAAMTGGQRVADDTVEPIHREMGQRVGPTLVDGSVIPSKLHRSQGVEDLPQDGGVLNRQVRELRRHPVRADREDGAVDAVDAVDAGAELCRRL
jgi:hypothetical protein